MKRALLLVALSFGTGCGGGSGDFDAADALANRVSGERAREHVAELVAFGPRPAGSEALEASRSYIEERLSEHGWVVKRQPFRADTPEGEVAFVNLRARFGEGRWDERATGLLCSHYDTKLYEGFDFVGANDAGSSTGLLIELARVLAEKPRLARGIELVFFDGEEAFGPNITPNDGLYGSKHYAGESIDWKEKRRPEWGLLLDMVGDRDLEIRAGVRIPRSSVRELVEAREQGYAVDIEAVEAEVQEMSRQLLSAASDLDLRAQVGVSPDYIVDDHVPLNVSAGIPTIDLIDFDYPYWHTPGDTLEKVSAESLEISGRVTLWLVEKYLSRW